MKHGMTIEYLKCRAGLNFKDYFGANGAIGTILAKWDLIYTDNGSFSSIIYIFLSANHMPLIMFYNIIYIIYYIKNK